MRRLALLLGMMALGPACGDDEGGTAGTGTSGTAGTSGTTGTSGTAGTTAGTSGATGTSGTTPADTTAEGTTAEGTTAAGTTAEGTTTSATEGATTEGATTGGMAMLDAQLTNLQIFQDCMPIVPPDPVGASATLALTNLGDASASATVTSATFLDAGGSQVATLDVSPGAFGPIPAGGSDMAAVSKVPGSLLPAAGCEVLQCDQSYALELVLDVDGVEVVASDAAIVGCVF